MINIPDVLEIKVELFGTPRLLTGRKEVALRLPRRVARATLIQVLAEACPQLVGTALLEDRSDLQEGFVFNHNGLAFLSDGDEAGDLELKPGDSLLLLSSQAGG